MSRDVEFDARLLELVKGLIEARPDLGYRWVEDFVDTTVEMYLKKHGQQV